MSATTLPLSRGPRPQGPRRPRERLASLKNKSTSLRQRSASLQPVRASSQPRCPECGSPELSDLDGTTVCAECGTTINDSNIVAEVTFGESSAGAAIVQGGFVGEGQRHAKTTQPGRNIYEAREPREVSEANGREEIRKQANWLNLGDPVVDQAIGIYKLALNRRFVQGRLIRVVAAVCLYAACRRDPKNQTILMDFAEAIAVNVFKLGQTWADLKKPLLLFDSNNVPVIEVENLIMKFVRKLEFGASHMKVAEDAARLLKRMKRDWIVTGRNPAGLVGACIILAARMNNFRRTVREVVYVVKVADVTLVKRIEEFKRTQSSALTVDQFRKHGLLLKTTHDPPALYERKMREERERDVQTIEQSSATNDGTDQANNRSEITPTPTQTAATRQSARLSSRRDAEGFVIPDIPASSALQNTTNSQKRRADAMSTAEEEPTQRKKAARSRTLEPRPTPMMVITEQDLIEENELEREMEYILNDPDSIAVVEDAAVNEEVEARAKALAESLRNPSSAVPFTVPDDPEIGEHEFENDPEVANCLLSEEERRVKERIWVTHNEDWLRSRQEKMLKKAADEASGAAKRQKRKRNRWRMGDGSLLEAGGPATSAADATRRMLDKHAVNPSKHINYQNVDRLYAELRAPGSSDGTETGSRVGSVGASEASELASNGSQTQDLNATQLSATNTQTSGNPQTQDVNTTQQDQEDGTDEGSDFEGEDSDPDLPEDPEEMSDEDLEVTLESYGFD